MKALRPRLPMCCGPGNQLPGAHSARNRKGAEVEILVGCTGAGKGIADQVRTSEEFARPVEVVLEQIAHVVRLTVIESDHAIEGPIIGEPRRNVGLREVVGPIPPEALANVEVRVGALSRGIVAVVGLRGVGNVVLAIAGVVDGVAPGEVRGRRQAVESCAASGWLAESCSSNCATRLELVDIAERQERRRFRSRVHLVQVDEAEELAALRSDITNVHSDTVRDLLLDVRGCSSERRVCAVSG